MQSKFSCSSIIFLRKEEAEIGKKGPESIADESKADQLKDDLMLQSLTVDDTDSDEDRQPLLNDEHEQQIFSKRGT